MTEPFWGLPGTNIPLPNQEYSPRDNTLFAGAREEMVSARFNWLTQSFYICICDASVEFDPEQVTPWSNLQEASVLLRLGPLVNKSITKGYCAANDITMSGITTQRDIGAFVMMRRASPDGAADIPVLLFRRIYGAPVRLKNEDFIMRWDRSFGGIFRP
jgi:hypothetical protein